MIAAESNGTTPLGRLPAPGGSMGPGVAVGRSRKAVIAGRHVIAEFIGDTSGPTLIVVGSLHGNEPAGVQALQTVARKLRGTHQELAGRVFFLAGNTRALSQHVRYLDADLNRYWTAENIAAADADGLPPLSEALELQELKTKLDSILGTARDEVYVLDLHSTSADGVPFATVGDTMRNRHFAQKFPVIIMLGIEEQLEGTMLEYLNNLGTVTLGFEAGQHDARSTVENHEALVWIALSNTGILRNGGSRAIKKCRGTLRAARGDARIVEVRYREAITPQDEFRMFEGFENFDPVERGQVLAHSRRGLLMSPENGMVLMPLYQKQGDDGFFIGREVAPFWIKLSEVLRNLDLGDKMAWLPGVKRDPADPMTFHVNTNIARLFPLQIFHLLGFRKLRWRGKKLLVSRRRHDTVSPFAKDGR